MATKKSIMVVFGVLVISAFILAFIIQAEAETLKYKSYTYATKNESAPVGDVKGHILNFGTRTAFIVFENGEVATQKSVSTADVIEGSGGSSITYSTLTFSDGSTIIIKSTNIVGETTPGKTRSTQMTREIIKGTGRFEGIKGTGTTTVKYFPVEEGEVGAKGIGEGSITYTLPSK